MSCPGCSWSHPQPISASAAEGCGGGSTASRGLRRRDSVECPSLRCHLAMKFCETSACRCRSCSLQHRAPVPAYSSKSKSTLATNDFFCLFNFNNRLSDLEQPLASSLHTSASSVCPLIPLPAPQSSSQMFRSRPVDPALRQLIVDGAHPCLSDLSPKHFLSSSYLLPSSFLSSFPRPTSTHLCLFFSHHAHCTKCHLQR